MVGCGFLDNIRSGLGLITSTLPMVRGVLEHAPHQYAQTGANVLKALGYGKGQKPLDNRLPRQMSAHWKPSLSRYTYTMPYNIAYNKYIAQQVRLLSQNHVNGEKEINDFAINYEVPSQVESSVMRYPEVHGGNGFAAATVQDLVFEPALGATSADAKPARRLVKTIEVGEGLSAAGVSAAGVSGGDTKGTRRKKGEGMSAAGVSAAGVSAAGAPAGGVSTGAAKHTRSKKGMGASGGDLLSLKDLDKMHGQPPQQMQSKATVKAEGSDKAVGGGGRSQ